jgi:predicted aminopeptidase
MVIAFARLLLAALVAAALLPSCYVLDQAAPYLEHRFGAVPLEEALTGAESTPAERRFYARLRDIRRFASESLGLELGKSYTRYYALERDYLVAVVQAAPRFSVDPYQFRYPLLGELPYRGYYDAEDAAVMAERLRARGLDVYVRRVDAFSSLGVFSDPLFSFAIGYTDARLAELLIHEQVHATLFVKRAPEFNEQLATFVGREGARQYIRSRYGESSATYRRLMNERADSEQFRADMAALTDSLERLYATSRSANALLSWKRRYIEGFQERFAKDYAQRYQTERYRGVASMEINNAFLSLFRIYETEEPIFRRLLERPGSLEAMMQRLRALDRSGELSEQPWKAVRDELR